MDYVAGGDLSINAGGSLLIGSGGSLVQTVGVGWMQIRGPITVDGGEFNTGSSTGFQLYTGTNLIVKSGTVRLSTGVAQNGTLRIEGGIVYAGTIGDNNGVQLLGGTLQKSSTFVVRNSTVLGGGNLVVTAGEFQYWNPFTLAGGTIRAPKIAPQATATVLTLTGGHLIATGTADLGFYKPAGSYINFTETSTGKVTFTNCTPANAYATYFAGADPRLRLAGATLSQADVTTFFDVLDSSVPGMGNSVDISLKQTQAGVASFVGDACAAGGLTATSATITATINDPGSPAADVYACYGTANGVLNFGAWQNHVLLGTAQGGTAYTSTPTLAADSVYFYRMAATNSSGIVFATPAPTFVMTAPVGVAAPASLPENSVAPAALVIARPAANNCSTVALSVPFTLGGTATLDTHYTLSSASPATIPVGASSVSLTLTPIADWSSGNDRTVEFTLGTSTSYLAPTQGVATVTLLNAVLPTYPTNAWLGAVSEDGTVAANWALGVVPAASHIIVFSPEYARRSLFWNVGMTSVVAGWLQPYAFADETRRVLFFTTPAAPLTIAGDCVLQGGAWVHDGPSATPTKAVAVNVQGNLTVGAAALIGAGSGVANVITAYARGYNAAGPGYVPSAGDQGTGSSYGGEGATNDVTYGSVLNPLSYGSSGRGDNAQFSGAGLIVLNVSGTTTLAGSILARGFGYTGTGRGASTGGSINLTTGDLLGNGTIGADGGRDLNYGSGSGGRIRVKLTSPGAVFSSFTGAITAHGNTGYPGSAAGTIALQTAADSAASALVVVDNAQFSDSTNAPYRAMCTHLPPKTQTDTSFAETSWRLRNYAAVRLTGNAKIASLSVEGTTPRLFTESYTLTTKEFVVNGDSAPAGTYTSGDYPALLFGNGAVVVVAQGTVVLVR